MVVCRKCGSNMDETEIICNKCGTKKAILKTFNFDNKMFLIQSAYLALGSLSLYLLVRFIMPFIDIMIRGKFQITFPGTFFMISIYLLTFLSGLFFIMSYHSFIHQKKHPSPRLMGLLGCSLFLVFLICLLLTSAIELFGIFLLFIFLIPTMILLFATLIYWKKLVVFEDEKILEYKKYEEENASLHTFIFDSKMLIIQSAYLAIGTISLYFFLDSLINWVVYFDDSYNIFNFYNIKILITIVLTLLSGVFLILAYNGFIHQKKHPLPRLLGLLGCSLFLGYKIFSIWAETYFVLSLHFTFILLSSIILIVAMILFFATLIYWKRLIQYDKNLNV